MTVSYLTFPASFIKKFCTMIDVDNKHQDTNSIARYGIRRVGAKKKAST